MQLQRETGRRMRKGTYPGFLLNEKGQVMQFICMNKIRNLDKKICIKTHDGEYADKQKYRSRLTVTWRNCVNKRAVVIGINPSKANDSKSDRTLTVTARFLNMYGIDEFLMLNIYENYATNPKDMGKKRKTKFQRFHHELEEADIIFIAWGVSKNHYKTEKRRIEKILKPYQEKLYCAVNENGNMPVHPRRIRYNYAIARYIV